MAKKFLWKKVFGNNVLYFDTKKSVGKKFSFGGKCMGTEDVCNHGKNGY